MQLVIAFALVLASSPVLAADPEPISFRADARVVLDAAGKPLTIEAAGDLPAPVREFIEHRIATWNYSAPERDGRSADAVTYLSLGACAIPVQGGGYRMAVDFKGNGPKEAGQALVPWYPAQARRAGQEASAVVSFVVETDGTATLGAIDYEDGGMYRRNGFDEAIKAWVGALRYVPEEFDGHPVRTRIEMPVEFVLAGPGERAKMKRESREKVLHSSECQLALHGEEGPLPVAMDSPVRVQPAG